MNSHNKKCLTAYSVQCQGQKERQNARKQMASWQMHGLRRTRHRQLPILPKALSLSTHTAQTTRPCAHPVISQVFSLCSSPAPLPATGHKTTPKSRSKGVAIPTGNDDARRWHLSFAARPPVTRMPMRRQRGLSEPLHSVPWPRPAPTLASQVSGAWVWVAGEGGVARFGKGCHPFVRPLLSKGLHACLCPYARLAFCLA